MFQRPVSPRTYSYAEGTACSPWPNESLGPYQGSVQPELSLVVRNPPPVHHLMPRPLVGPRLERPAGLFELHSHGSYLDSQAIE